MNNIESLSSSYILNTDIPEIIFSNNINNAKKEFRLLANKWHPDKNKSKNSTEVFKKINELYKLAIEKINSGTWCLPNEVRIIDIDGHTEYHIRFKKHHKFSLGDMYIADSMVAYIIDGKEKDLFNNFKNVSNIFTFSSDKMKKEISKCLPHVLKTFSTKDGRYGVVVSKTKDLLLLKDVVTYFKGKIDPKHTAWILSSLYNFSCYLNFIGISHGDINLDTYFISPEFHSGALLGGWWYTSKFGTKIEVLPSKSYELIWTDLDFMKNCNSTLDLESIKEVGRGLLGDSSGLKLSKISSAPKDMIDWLKWPTSGKAVKDYEKWSKEVLINSFGKKRFVVMNLKSEEIY